MYLSTPYKYYLYMYMEGILVWLYNSRNESRLLKRLPASPQPIVLYYMYIIYSYYRFYFNDQEHSYAMVCMNEHIYIHRYPSVLRLGCVGGKGIQSYIQGVTCPV